MHLSGTSLYCVCLILVCLGGKWSGEWQISKNFGACGASGKFFSKFRETLIHPNRVRDSHSTLAGSRAVTLGGQVPPNAAAPRLCRANPDLILIYPE